MNPHEPLILTERKKFHAGLLASVITVKGGVPSIADKDNCLSVKIASAIIAQIGTSTERDRIAAQTSGDTFEIACAAFLTATFGSLLPVSQRPTQRWSLAGGQELKQAVSQNGHEDSQELLHIMIEGKRLRDIADLPLDLAT